MESFGLFKTWTCLKLPWDLLPTGLPHLAVLFMVMIFTESFRALWVNQDWGGKKEELITARMYVNKHFLFIINQPLTYSIALFYNICIFRLTFDVKENTEFKESRIGIHLANHPRLLSWKEYIIKHTYL